MKSIRSAQAISNLLQACYKQMKTGSFNRSEVERLRDLFNAMSEACTRLLQRIDDNDNDKERSKL